MPSARQILERFADVEAGPYDSPLYERLARAGAFDNAICALLEEAPPEQRRATLLFAAVHYLLLRGGEEPLARFYGVRPLPADPFPAFRAFCAAHRDELVDLLRTRSTQTNEPRRSAALYPALTVAARHARGPLALLEVGASAGLNLLGDSYRYSYSNGQTAGASAGTVHVRSAVRGRLAPPLADALPVAWRAGIDPDPVDPRDDERTRWLRACVWGDQLDRAALLEAALAHAASGPPPIYRGRAQDLLAAVAAKAPAATTICLYHTSTLGYLSEPERDDFFREVFALAQKRPLIWLPGDVFPRQHGLERRILSQEPAAKPDEAYAHMAMISFEETPPCGRLLSRFDLHGRWLEWLDESSASRSRPV